jgi:PleD family two-component response regulator
MVTMADDALYAAKREGRDRVCLGRHNSVFRS